MIKINEVTFFFHSLRIPYTMFCLYLLYFKLSLTNSVIYVVIAYDRHNFIFGLGGVVS